MAARRPILMPKLGLTMTEGTLLEWKVAPGDRVKAGDVIFIVETDKLTNDIEAESDGVIEALHATPGEVHDVGEALATLVVEEDPVDVAALLNRVSEGAEEMNFELSDEQVMLADTARRVAGKFGLDYWRELDAAAAFPAAIWQAICDAGLCGIAIPEAYGGSGLGMLELAICIENLCAGGGGVTLSQMFMLNPIFGGVTLTRLGSDAQKAALLPGLVRGEVMFAMALTEPNAGSNSLEVQTFATAEGSGWRLNGQKIWITAVPQASKLLVIARTKTLADSRGKTDGISLFMIDRDREGITHRAVDKLGTRTLPSSLVYFDNVRIDSAELLGTLHEGFRQLLDVLNTERIVTTAGLVGTAEIATRLAIDYANERKVFAGRPIGSYQAIQFPLAEAHIQSECARLMNYRAATLHDQGKPYGSAANMGKWLAGHAAGLATDRAIQTLGGMGYSKECHVERLWRDARLFRIAPISEEMVLNFVAQHDLGMPRSY